jgi:hypothetical protein
MHEFFSVRIRFSGTTIKLDKNLDQKLRLWFLGTLVRGP